MRGTSEQLVLFLGCQISAKASEVSLLINVIKGAETGDIYHCIVYHWEPKDKRVALLLFQMSGW